MRGRTFTSGPGSGARSGIRFRRTRDRERLRLVKGLRSVSRRAGTSGRARRFEVLLCERAAAVRSDLLEVAAALERVVDPDPSTLSTLRWLLTDGCTSPLYNPAVPGGDLAAILDLVRSELDGLDPSTNATNRGPVTDGDWRMTSRADAAGSQSANRKEGKP
jgi:hypothetical protein